MIEFNRKNPDTSGVYWLTSCLSKDRDEGRFHLLHIQIKDGNFCATDGRRLHYFNPVTAYGDGYYKVIKRTKTLIHLEKAEDWDGCYPEIDDFINFDGARITFSINGRNVSKDENADHASQVTAAIIRKMAPNEAIRFDFIMDALTNDNMFDVFVEDDSKPIKFKSENKIAVIMPIRMSIDVEA